MSDVDARIPATVLTGFLGSGKTTLLNRLLREPEGRKLAVIVNEFGEIGIDGQLLPAGEHFVELDNGCLCCALNEDLERTLLELAQRGGFEHLIIETTGLADPLPIAWIFARPSLSKSFRLDGIVTTVDALHVEETAAQHVEAAQQIVRADLLVLRKLDLVSDGGAQARRIVAAYNELAPILTDVDWTTLLGPKTRAPLPSLRHEHDANLESFVYRTDVAIDEAALEDLLHDMPPTIFRVKGLLRSTASDFPYIVAHKVGARVDLEPRTFDTPPRALGLVFIGRPLDTKALQAACEEAFAG